MTTQIPHFGQVTHEHAMRSAMRKLYGPRVVRGFKAVLHFFVYHSQSPQGEGAADSCGVAHRRNLMHPCFAVDASLQNLHRGWRFKLPQTRTGKAGRLPFASLAENFVRSLRFTNRVTIFDSRLWYAKQAAGLIAG